MCRHCLSPVRGSPDTPGSCPALSVSGVCRRDPGGRLCWVTCQECVCMTRREDTGKDSIHYVTKRRAGGSQAQEQRQGVRCRETGAMQRAQGAVSGAQGGYAASRPAVVAGSEQTQLRSRQRRRSGPGSREVRRAGGCWAGLWRRHLLELAGRAGAGCPGPVSLALRADCPRQSWKGAWVPREICSLAMGSKWTASRLWLCFG